MGQQKICVVYLPMYVCNMSKSVRIMLCECMVLQGPTVPRLLVSTLCIDGKSELRKSIEIV